MIPTFPGDDGMEPSQSSEMNDISTDLDGSKVLGTCLNFE